MKTNLPTKIRHSKKRRDQDKNISIEYIKSMIKSNIARFEAIRKQAYNQEQRQKYLENCIKYRVAPDQEIMTKFEVLSLDS